MAWDRAFIAVYMMANRPYGTLYTGVSSTMISRVRDHRDGVGSAFTQRWGLTRLVWYQPFESIAYAIRKEKLIKRYSRDWKINLIERLNPRWEDLYPALICDPEWKHDPTAE
jgi:putative endonuclease